ncbi:MAG: hypothetical protein J5631_05965 [Spirochaetaceae bacterium]|nr:hypothetical protein [Spirochaetaceae bacterium]
MRTRKLVLFVMMVALALLFVSCATTDDGPSNAYAGKYKGTWVEEGKNNSGTWSFTINEKGRVFGSFASGGYTASPNGYIDDSGNMTISVPDWGVSATATIDSDGEVNGTWTGSNNSKGTLTGTKQ